MNSLQNHAEHNDADQSDAERQAILPTIFLIGFFVVLLALLLPRANVRVVTSGETISAEATETLTDASAADAGTRIAAVASPAVEPMLEQAGVAAADGREAVTSPAAGIEVAAETAAAYSAEQIALGQQVFGTTCSACHGMDARGVAGLGKNLIDSAFVHDLSDDDLVQFIIIGRDAFHPENTTGIGMPARGGNPMVTDAELMAVVAYLRSQSGMSPVVSAAPVGEAVAQAATQVPVTPVFTSEPTSVPSPTQTVSLSESGSALPIATLSLPTPLPTAIPTLDPNFDSAAAYAWACAGCHGLDGRGAGVAGPGLQNGLLIADADALRAFLSQQQPPLDPAIAFPHPVRGGYPALTEAQLDALIEYVQQLVAVTN